MKLLALLLASAGLSGCVAYGGAPYGAAGYYDGGYYGYSTPYVIEQPIYMYGSGGYRYRPDDRHSGRRGDRDRDRDGIPNRLDRDRDGDGVPNRQDRRPSNPRRQ